MIDIIEVDENNRGLSANCNYDNGQNTIEFEFESEDIRQKVFLNINDYIFDKNELKYDPFEINNDKEEQEKQLNQMMMASMRNTFLIKLPDEQAKDIPYCYSPWSDYADGYEFIENKERVEHNGGLWRCKKTHKKQVSWYPGADPTLWEQLDKENHDGTELDPTPVPDSVTTSGFTYTYGKYYLENGITYLCKRGGIPDEQAEAMYGKSETLYFAPSTLVGTYFEVA